MSFWSNQVSTASRTVPTLYVLVITTGPPSTPPSFTQAVPMRSPNPLPANLPAKTGSHILPFGNTAVTPVRTGVRTVAGDDRRVSDFDAGDVGDGIQLSRGPVERDAEVAGPRTGCLRRD